LNLVTQQKKREGGTVIDGTALGADRASLRRSNMRWPRGEKDLPHSML